MCGEHAFGGGDEDGGAATKTNERGCVLLGGFIGVPFIFGWVGGQIFGVAFLE